MVGIWAELMTDAEIRAALPALARAGHYLALALPAERIGDEAFSRLTREARDRGVGLRAWPLLSIESGYWINVTNIEQAAELIEALLAWRERPNGPVFDAISFDLEPAYEYAEKLRRFGRTSPLSLLKLLFEHLDRAQFVRARSRLAQTVERVRRAGLGAHAVAIPLLLDQPETNDLLEDALDTPLSRIDWDEISFMAYQTPFAQLAGNWLGPSLVHSYAASAIERYGSRAGIDLGIVGNAGVGVDAGNRYPDPQALRSDLAAALAAGISAERIRIYGLKGVLECGGVDRWLDFSGLEAALPEPNRAVQGLRNGVGAVVTALRVSRIA